MPFPSVQEVIKDPDFLGLPESEKQAVLSRIDPDFSGLPGAEQAKVIQSFSGVRSPAPRNAQPSGILGTLPGDIPHDPSGRDMDAYNEKFQNAARTASKYYRPALEAGGGIVGSVAGAPGGPLTTMAGGAMGYGMGHKGADALDQMLGVSDPRSVPEELADTAGVLKEGAMWEMGGMSIGAAIRPIVKGGKIAFDYIRKPLKPEKAASRILAANTSAGPIYAKNIKQAKRLEKKIPGLKFTLGQRSADPELIKMERAEMRKGAPGAWLNADQIAANDDALQRYYQKNFPEAEGVDEVYQVLQKNRAGLNQTAADAGQTVSNMADRLPRTTPQQTGENILSTIDTAKQPIKQTMNKLESVIPDYPMTFNNYDEAVNSALKNRKAAPKEKAFINRLHKTLVGLRRAEGETTHISQAMRRALNDAYSEAEKTVPSATAPIMRIKEALISDIDEVSKLARTGKISEYKGRMIDADKLAEELERNTLKIAEMETATAPDIDAMVKALDERGVPTMMQRAEGKKSYLNRIQNDFKRIIGKDVPVKQVYGGGSAQPKKALSRFENSKNILYHGTDAPGFSKFDLSKAGSSTDEGLLGEGIYFSTDPNIARGNKTKISALPQKELKLLKVSLPKWASDKSEIVNAAIGTKALTGKNLTKAVKSRGFDGVELDYSPVGYNHKEIVIYDPKNIITKQQAEAVTSNPEIQSIIDRNDQIKTILSEVSPGQDVAAQIKAYNDFASDEYFGRFGKGATDRATATGQEFAGTRSRGENIPSLFKTASGADDLIRAVGPEKARGMMQENLNYDLLQNATDPSGAITQRKLKSWIKRYKPVLKKFGIESEYDQLAKAQEIADTARQTAKDFEKTAAAKLLNADPERAIAASIRGNNTQQGARELLNQVKDNPAAKRGLQKAFADHIFDQIKVNAQDVKGAARIGNAKFSNIMKKYAPAMRVLYKDQPQKIKALVNMQKAVQTMSRNAASPLGGGSDTAENLSKIFSNIAGPAVSSRFAVVNAVRMAGNLIGKYGQKQVDNILMRAVFDPDYAEILTKAAKGKIKPDMAIKQLDNNIIHLSDYQNRIKDAAAAAGGLAIVNQDQ